MSTAFKIFLLGIAVSGLAIVLGARSSTATPAMQDDAGNPAPR